jgi:hypothetical protein
VKILLLISVHSDQADCVVEVHDIYR